MQENTSYIINSFSNNPILYLLKKLCDHTKFEQVVPAELETLLMKHPQIADAAVIGIPDKDDPDNEYPRAYIVKQENANITENDVIQYIAGTMLLF